MAFSPLNLARTYAAACPNCNGYGWLYGDPCPQCDGFRERGPNAWEERMRAASHKLALKRAVEALNDNRKGEG